MENCAKMRQLPLTILWMVLSRYLLTGLTFTEQAYLEPCRTSMMDFFFAKIVYDTKSLTIFAKNSIIDAWQGPKCASTLFKLLQIMEKNLPWFVAT